MVQTGTCTERRALSLEEKWKTSEELDMKTKNAWISRVSTQVSDATCQTLF